MSRYDRKGSNAPARHRNARRIAAGAQAKIAGLLAERGRTLFHAPRRAIRFTKDAAADRLLNDIEGHPHAFVLGCVMDRQISASKAWHIPQYFAMSLGSFSIESLARLSVSKVKRLMSGPPRLHRFPTAMYEGDASRIWSGTPPSAEVVYRFLEFDGIGPKIATMAVNLLAREFKVPFADHYSIDVSADVHVRRVFVRLGLCAPKASVEEIIYKARASALTTPACWTRRAGRSGETGADPNDRSATLAT
jgi:hypothetical protein